MKHLITALLLAAACSRAGWQEDLAGQLPLLGHRNWIVIADSAYPLQTAPGIQTVYAGGNQLDAVQQVLSMISGCRHVKPAIYLDEELPYVAEKNAAGIGDYRDGLNKLLSGNKVLSLPHEEIIAKLDEAGKTFKILIIKTDMTLPYTSVFIRLDCGYWNSAAETELRKAIQ